MMAVVCQITFSLLVLDRLTLTAFLTVTTNKTCLWQKHMILERELFIMQHIGMHTVAVLSIVSTVLIIAIVCPGGKRNPKINIRAQLKILMEKPIITQETVVTGTTIYYQDFDLNHYTSLTI